MSPPQGAPSPAGAAPPQREPALYIPSLDGMRTVAVMLVIVAHGFEQVFGHFARTRPLDGAIPNFIPGSFGVTIFFFLSGFLITTLMRLEHEKTGTLSLKLFYLRRAARILPPFYLVLAAATAATAAGLLRNSVDPWAVSLQALHLTNYRIALHGWWDGIAPGTWIFWSLAIEEHFYLVFPWAFLALARLPEPRTRVRILWAACGAALVWRVVLVFVIGAGKDWTYAATDARFDSILFGCILGLSGNPVMDSSATSERTWKYVLFPLGLVGLAASFVVGKLFARAGLPESWFNETARYSLQGLCLFPVYITVVRYPSWALARPLNAGWMRALGWLSYALYLVHPPLFEALELHAFPLLDRALPGRSGPVFLAVFFAVALPLCIGVSAAIYVFVEKPMGRLRKRLQAGVRSAPPV